MPKVFLSYSSQDEAFVRKLYDRLTRDGVDCFFDRESLEAGSSWVEKLEQEIKASDWLILVVTPDYLNSPWTKKERNAAMAISHVGKPIIPLRRQDCDMPLFLQDLQPLDVRPDRDFEVAYIKLCKALRITPVTEKPLEKQKPPTDRTPFLANAVLHALVEQVFVGRHDELQTLRSLLESPGSELRPVAICAVEGMPGVGKTYLADRFAQQHAANFPGGFIRLVLDPHSSSDAEHLRDQLRDRLKISSPESSAWDALQQRLRLPRALLHVENVDSLAAEVSAVQLLSKLPGCAVLVTGRVRDLGRSSGWRQLRLRPFDEATALKQLQQEIGEDSPNPSLPEQRQLVETLGYLPLAIHLAAGHLRSGRTVAGFLEHLSQHGLKVGPVSPAQLAVSPDRTRLILSSTFEISLQVLQEQLGDRSQSLLLGLKALGHAPLVGFGRSMGQAITGLFRADFEELVVQAQGLSMLLTVPPSERPDGAWRLHPLLAEFLRRQCDAGPPFDLMSRWFLQRFQEGGEEQGVRWGEVHSEHLALTSWLKQLPPNRRVEVKDRSMSYAIHSGPFHAWARFCREALDADLEDRHRSDFLWILARASLRRGDLETAHESARQMVSLDSKRGDARATALGWGVIADIQQAWGDLDEALRIRRKEELLIHLKLGDIREQAVTIGKIADVLQVRGELDEALRIRQEEELPVYEKLGDIRSRAVAMGKVAGTLLVRGDLDEALRIHREEQLPIYDTLGDIRSRAIAVGKVADILQLRGDLDEALRIRREEQLPVYDKLGDLRSRAVAMGKVADILQARGDLDGALCIRQEEELPVYNKLGDIRSRAVTMGKVAEILRSQGDLDEALRIRRKEELPVYEKLGAVRDLLIGRAHTALIYLERGRKRDRERAKGLLMAALADADRLRIPEAGEIRGILQLNQLEEGREN